MSRRDQWPHPGHGHGYNPHAPGVQWHGAASTSAPGPDAAAAQGITPYAFAPFPQFAPNPFNEVVSNLLFQNPASLSVFHQLQQQQQYHQQQVQHFPSHVYHQNPTPSMQHRPAKPAAASSSAPTPPQPQQKAQPQPHNQQATIGKAHAAAKKVRDELLRSGEGVTGWKLAQAVLVELKVDSWDFLGIHLHEVPLLRDIFLVEGKVNTFIHCYVAARKIVTVYDLEVEICKNEGIGKFEELGLGPFLQHPLVVHYFSAAADLSMVPKLSSEEIINFLQKFVDNSKKKITVEDFLDYLVKQLSVPGKEKLGVRIQALGLHISLLRQARRAEVDSVKLVGKMSGSGHSSQEKDLSKKPIIHTDKKALDKRFNSITSRIKQLPGINKHIHFDSTDDEVDGNSSSEDDKLNGNESKNGTSVLNNKDGDKRASSCPYPSKTEEMERLGLTSEISRRPALDSGKVRERGKKGDSKEKRKVEENDSPHSLCERPKKLQKVQRQKHEMSPNCFLSISKLENFITTWKETCRERPVQQVLEMIANYYARTPKEKKKVINFCSQYPGIGLFNVAVRSMGCGLLDSIYDAIQLIGENNVSSGLIPNTTTEVMEIEPPSSENIKCTAKETSDISKGNGNRHSVAIDDVIRRISGYIESNFKVSGDGALLVRMLHDCETWVTAQFSAKEFSDLGHGTFLEFLEKHARHFSLLLCGFLKGGSSDSLSLEVSVLQQQIEVLFCQAESNWLEDGHVSEDSFLMLLNRQFPTISFDTVHGKSVEKLTGYIDRQRKNIQTNSIRFSISLLEKQWFRILSGGHGHDNVEGLANDVQKSYYSETVCSREAINCLLKAPMLSDLLLWSHWDMLFAPSLGSFIPWLLNTGPIQELSCIVTTDGRFIRVDSSVTVDQFLEAIIQRSPFLVAVKLLSLLYIYDGSTNTPISLLKCYAQRAMTVIVDNSNDLMNPKSESKLFMPEESGNANLIQRVHSNHFGSDRISNIDNTARLVAKFIVDCLGHLPPEFRSLAADILLAGFRIITKNCYSVMLQEATENWQLCMLHDIGLSLGVAEWVEDCRRLCLTEEAHAKTEVRSSSKHTASTSEGATHENSNILISNDSVLNDERKSSPGTNGQATAIDSRDQMVLSPVRTEADIAELHGTNKSSVMGEKILEEATLVIETIRREEFGLNRELSYTENSLLKKQHARLGRALHCLSQELYSQDSHLLLELVQNADDNTYPEDVEPTLAFILQDNGIVVLNNEMGFSAENIRALCDIGNSTKKGSNMGYIGNKGIGFKSVFRVTDAPEIHSNGFHVKFDITEGQIGFVLPTAVPPYNTSPLSRMLCFEKDNDSSSFSTCIRLPFRSKFREGTGMCSIVSMFSDLHPSLLLFLHRLKCIKFKNLLNNTLLVMRRESLGDGIVRISHGTEIMSWLVVSKKLHGTVVRHDVCTTEISVAFTLQETENGDYEPYLKQQPVFAFLPLRNYGLKFILQGDFVLPSSREEVDADSAWNQWLLSEFPSLFVSAQESFCALPCFQRFPGKAVTAFLSFIPLVGEVHGFFSQLPHLILSKLRLTRCMFLDGSSLQRVYPCNTLRGWDQQTKMLLSDDLLHKHLGLGYLSKDIVLSDKLSRALGIHDYGPKILMDTILSICRTNGCIESLGLEWLCAWFVTLYLAMLSHSSRSVCLRTTLEDDLLNTIRKIQCIPLSDGSFTSIADGPIWLPYDIVTSITESRNSIQSFPIIYDNLRTVSPDLLSASCKNKYLMEEVRTNDLVDILLKIGVRKLSGHDIIKNHIMISLRNGIDATMTDKTMIEYMSFIMLHLQSSCTSCNYEKEEIVSELRKRPIFLTNQGYKCPADEPIHFSKDYGNSIDVGRLLRNVEFDWIELDSTYLTSHRSDSSLFEIKKWRQFFEEMGVTDFVQIVKVEKNILQADSFLAGSHSHDDSSGKPSTVFDWQSSELASILSIFSSKGLRENCIYLLEVLDKLWDDFYSAKTRCLANATHYVENAMVESSFLKCIRSFKWIASSMDEDLHNATDLFYDFESVRSLLGSVAPYAVPQVSSYSLRNDIGFKTEVSYSDALMVLKSWIASQVPFRASMNQMCKFYSFLSEGVVDLKIDIKREFLSCSYIFTPLQRPRSSEAVPGKFFTPEDLYWHDPTGCSELAEELISMKKTRTVFPRRLLSVSYPTLCEFFTEVCGVPKTPTTSNYVEILLRLSKFASPSQAANHVFRVFVRWANDINPETDKMNDILYLKESLQKLETTILPTSVDKWVSLHSSFGLVCWVDDDELKQQFQGSSSVDFIQFGDLSSEDKQMLYGRVAALMKNLGIPALSKVMCREAIFYGTADNREKTALICWLLPYMQRYIYKMHRDTYMNFQKNETMKLTTLQVVVVDKLFYKYVLRGLDSSSMKRFECHCLLQGNTLYATQDADSHSVCLELSRIFFDGSPDLHFANFLHMIKTMAESGTTVEQLESFISNNQNIPELPDHEAVWSFSSISVAQQTIDSQMVEFRSTGELNIPNHQRAPGTVTSWPPNNWKTAPDFRMSQKIHHAYMPDAKGNGAGTLSDLTVRVRGGHAEDTLVPVDIEGDWIIEANTMTENTFFADSTAANLDEPQMISADPSSFGDPSSAPIYLDLETGSSSPTVDVEIANFNEKLASVPEERSSDAGTPDASQLRTGRIGEALVHKYFAEQLGSNNVRWVNQESETGLPYDIVITHKGNFTEYVEVKATVSSKKDWFYLTSNEWQFALEKGDSFSIARVVLSGTKKASIEMLKNPYKLYQQKALRLVLLISR